MADKKEEKVVNLTDRAEVVATKTFPGREEGEKFKVSTLLVDSFKKKGFIK
jgi:hypothetical protein